jgi:Lon protease-like protein
VVKERTVEIPIFPLPRSILFPGIYVPFHIFEERYKTMLKKVEETQSHLAVSYAPELQPGKNFPCMVCGAGPVRVIRRYESGESDIIVLGLERIRFHKYIQEVPYLIGEGEILPINREMPKSTEDQLLTEIREMLINWVFTNFDESNRPIQFFKNSSDLEPLCNFVAYYFVNDLDRKQRLLEEELLENKAQAIWQVLKDLEDSGGPGPRSANGHPLIFPGNKKDGGGSGPVN